MTNFTWHHRAQESIAHGALTNSKRPQSHVLGVYPTHLKRGRGCYVWDTDGKQYIDFITGLGCNLLGYANQRISAAIIEQGQHGATLSLGSTIEVEAAEKVKELFPFIQKLRFLKTGTDACSAACIIARAKTGRLKILSEGYHGWSDGFVSLTPPALGRPSAADLHYEKFTHLEQITGDIAAVIIEPVIVDDSRVRIEWLRTLREKCTSAGVVLIFDEVITGFRYRNWSVTRTYGINPDLIILGKAIANGMPLSVIGGRTDIMEYDEYFISSTFAGETLSLASAIMTMKLLQTKFKVEDLWFHGETFIKNFNAIAPEIVKIDGYATRGNFVGDSLNKALFFQESCRAGILFGPSWFFNFPLIDEAKNVLHSCNDILGRIRNGEVKLQGEMPRSAFADRVRRGA